MSVLKHRKCLSKSIIYFVIILLNLNALSGMLKIILNLVIVLDVALFFYVFFLIIYFAMS